MSDAWAIILGGFAGGILGSLAAAAAIRVMTRSAPEWMRR